jgi:hypothetical protein
MSMRFSKAALVTAVAAAVVVAPAATPATADAKPGKRAKAAKPKITRVAPMRLNVGDKLVIRGKNFKAKKRRNTVIFRGSGGRTAFAKPRRASKRKLVVKVPASVARLLVVRDGKQRPTRLKLRVLAGKFSRFTPRRLSPVVLGVGAGGGGEDKKPLAACNSSSDHDNDLLLNQREIEIGTDPCLIDTDGDGLSDGWEYFSAKDLNIKAVPYPGKRPYPNPLDPSDRGIDFDGDGLLAEEEYRAWRFTGSSFDPGKAGGLDLESPLGYSDGTQYSRASEEPIAPEWKSAAFGLTPPTTPFSATYDLHDDPEWRDDERDADRDGLSNWFESKRGPGQPEWWPGFWGQEEYGIAAWPEPLACGQRPGAFNQRPFAELNLADPDVDGDELLDGEDDQDNDDFTNIEELYEVVTDLDGDGNTACGHLDIPSHFFNGESRVVNAFNPCAPDQESRTCPIYIPF